MRAGRTGRRLVLGGGALLGAAGGALLLLRWGMLCTSHTVWQHVDKVVSTSSTFLFYVYVTEKNGQWSQKNATNPTGPVT